MANDPKTSSSSSSGTPPADNPARCGYGGESGHDTSWSGPSSATYSGAGSSTQQENGARRPDDRINEEVCHRLTEAPAIDAGDIAVTVDDGAVTLSGTVPEPADARLSEELAGQAPGVREVRNELRVRKQE